MKRLMTCLALSAFATLLGGVSAPVAYAQSDRENSTFTLTEPLEVGQFTLQPGTYLLRVLMLQSDRNVIQVTDVDQSKVFATVIATPHPIRAREVLPSTRYVYYPAVPGQNKALRTWYARDTSNGQDIVYPRKRALELAVAAKEPVIAIPDEVKEAEYQSVPLAVVTPAREVKPYQAPMVEPVPEPAPAAVAEARPHAKMPRTASSVPLSAALGLLSLGAALGLRRLASPAA